LQALACIGLNRLGYLMDIHQDLIEACINGERKAQYELYKASYSYLMSICVRYTRNTDRAKEVLNIGFLKVLTNLTKYNPEIPFKPWVRKVMINALINEYKKEKIHSGNIEYIEGYHESDQHSEINQAITKIDVDQIYAFIAELPPASQHVFNLYYVEGYKHKEISSMLNISEGTSKWHLNSAREKLKEMLNEFNLPVKLSTHE
jgi:RNA polymerase sigma factor (sigma-70 family)